jgi:hypothetical protein
VIEDRKKLARDAERAARTTNSVLLPKKTNKKSALAARKIACDASKSLLRRPTGSSDLTSSDRFMSFFLADAIARVSDASKMSLDATEVAFGLGIIGAMARSTTAGKPTLVALVVPSVWTERS